MKFELDLFRKITDELLQDEKENPVLPPIHPKNISNVLDLDLSENGSSDDDFAKAIRNLVFNTPRTTTKSFFNQLFGGRNAKATLGDLLAVVLNNAMHTYKVSGPMVEIEKIMVSHFNQLIGYKNNAGGTMASGGSMTNFMAILMARDKAQESIKNKGVQHKLIAYTSKESHYSVSKNAAFIGIGREQVRYIESNDDGEMDTILLQKTIEQDLNKGYQPFFVNATAGTTVMGAFDPLDKIAALCKKYNLWLHADGAYCGSVILSKKYRHLVNGAANTDSFSLNAHKMLGTPLTCSFIMVKDKKYLHDSFSNNASYLFQMDEDEYNLGKISLQCGRRNDGLKLWTLWKSVGHKGLEKIVDHQFYLAAQGREYVRNHPDYTLYSKEDTLSICFNYKDIAPEEICAGLYEHGKLMVGYGSFKGDTFVRLITINYSNSKEDILSFFKKLEAFATKHYSLSLNPA